MAWNYAELSKAAKEAGGPEAFVDALAKASREQGRLDMIAFAGGVGVVVGICKLIKWFKTKQDEAQEMVDKAKTQLALEIEKYDLEHQNDDSNIIEASESEKE
jgi:hypothetical protein